MFGTSVIAGTVAMDTLDRAVYNKQSQMQVKQVRSNQCAINFASRSHNSYYCCSNNIFRILQLWSAEVNILRTNQTLIGIVYRKLFHQHPATSNQLHHQVNQQSDHNFVSFSILNAEIPSRLVSCISVGASGCWKAWHQINSLVQWNRATKLWFTSIDERLCQGSTYLHRSPIEWRYCRQPKIDASRVSRYITGLNATPTIFEPHCQQIDLFVSFLSFSNLWTSHYWLTIR